MLSRRQRRVGESIRAELSRLLTRDVHDPELSWTTITTAEMSADLRSAHIYFVSTGGGDQNRMRRSLERASTFLQRELGQRLKLRYAPKLIFHHDDSFDQGSRVDQLIVEARNEDTARSGEDTPECQLAHLITEADRILVATHTNPDGDAIGSMLGLNRIFSLLGKRSIAYCPDGIPVTLRFLPGADDVATHLDEAECFDLTVIVDTAAPNLLPTGLPPPERRGTLVVIDHHLQHGELGDVVIRRDSAAVGELLFDLSRELVWPVDRQVSLCFYASIVADTGSFRYSSTTPHTHAVAGELLALGADPWLVATALYESYPLARQRLLAMVLDTLQIACDGRYADMTAAPQMLQRAGAAKADLDGMINFGRAVQGVEISAMFRCESDGSIKVSFRSKGNVDVGSLASSLGGGGHTNAAGCTLTGMDLDAAKDKIRATVADLLAHSSRIDGPTDR